MWQRIQSIFLLLAAIALGLLFLPAMSFISISGSQAALQQADVGMLADGVLNIQDQVVFQILTVLGAIASVAAIFMFKNRSLQITLSRLTLVASIVIMILSAVFFYLDYQLIEANTLISGDYGILSPVLGVLFSFLAIRNIKKDDQLVKSSDRLR
jgi:hypothetical protein